VALAHLPQISEHESSERWGFVRTLLLLQKVLSGRTFDETVTG
jgi:hypothetical protein